MRVWAAIPQGDVPAVEVQGLPLSERGWCSKWDLQTGWVLACAWSPVSWEAWRWDYMKAHLVPSGATQS